MQKNRKVVRSVAAASLASACVLGMAGCAGTDSSPQADGDKQFTIVMQNGFVSDWRTQMLDMATEMAQSNEPYAGNIDFKTVQSSGDVSAQIQSLNNIIATKPDAILIDALSPTALNPVVEKACAQGITVVYFDQVGEGMASCAYRVHVDLPALFEANAKWLAERIGGQGKILLDLGLAGSPVSLAGVAAAEKVFAEYPDITIAGRYEGNYTPGPTKQAVTSILTTQKDIAGVYGIAGLDGAVQAFLETDTPLVPMTNTGDMSARLVNMIREHQEDGLEFAMAMNSPVIAGQALQVAWAALNEDDIFGDEWGFTMGDDEKDVLTPRMVYFSDDATPPSGFVAVTFAEALEMADQVPDAVQLPFSLPQSPVDASAIIGK